MSIETSIAALMASLNSALALPQQILDMAADKVDAIGDEYRSRIANLSTTFYINAITGDDTNAGTINAPMLSIQAAVLKTPFGGICTVYLQTDYTFSAANCPSGITSINGRSLIIASDSSTRRRVTWDVYRQNINGTFYRRTYALVPAQGASIVFLGLTLVMPAVSGFESDALSQMAACIYNDYSPFMYAVRVNLSLCNIEIPTGAFGPFLAFMPIELMVNAVVLTGPVTSYLGRLLHGVTNTSGTNINTLPGVLSNLTSI